MKKYPICCILFLLHFYCESQDLNFEFYGQDIRLKIHEQSIIKKKGKSNLEGQKYFYSNSQVSDQNTFVASLLEYKKRLQLNDWIYFHLLKEVSTNLYKNKTNSIYCHWFLLGQSGYHTRLAFSKGGVLLLMESSENVSGLRRTGNYYCLNCEDLNAESFTLSRFDPFKGKGMFSFDFDPLPNFNETEFISKTINFLEGNSIIKHEIKFGTHLIQSLKDRKNFSMYQTFSVPFSNESNKLIEKIADHLRNVDDSTKVMYIMNFVINNSTYKTDVELFGKEKWMTPDEFLFYDSGDCEDMSSFTFSALKSIVKKPLVIIDYPAVEHINVGINLNLSIPADFYYNGLPYYVCETSTDVGALPLGNNELIKNTRYKIIGEYIPLN